MINKTKSPFKKINRINKALARQNKKWKTQIK